ncbi:hypothetical protein Tco_0241688 [Tanacetum coccineum]
MGILLLLFMHFKNPWGSYVWAKLYRQLRYANNSRWDRFYACQALPNRPPAKYTLSGFTWAFKGQSKPVEVREPYGVPPGFLKCFTDAASDSFLDVEPNAVPITMLVEINPDAMHRGKRETFQANTTEHHSLVVRYKYTDCMTFLESPESVYLDCFIKGFVVEVQFWRELLPYLCKGAISTGSNLTIVGCSADQINFGCELYSKLGPAGARYNSGQNGTIHSACSNVRKFLIETDFHLMGMLDGSSRPYPSWDEVNIVYIPINTGGNHW